MTTENETETEYEPPIVTRAVTDNLKGDVPITWQLQGPHPYVTDMKVMAMFLHSGILEIYSTDGKTGLRERIPLSRVRITQEHISSDIFNDELDASEAKHLDIDEEEEPDTLSPTNGTATA